MSKLLFNVYRVVVTSPEYIKINGSPSCPEDIGSHKCLAFKHENLLNTWNGHCGAIPLSDTTTTDRG